MRPRGTTSSHSSSARFRSASLNRLTGRGPPNPSLARHNHRVEWLASQGLHRPAATRQRWPPGCSGRRLHPPTFLPRRRDVWVAALTAWGIRSLEPGTVALVLAVGVMAIYLAAMLPASTWLSVGAWASGCARPSTSSVSTACASARATPPEVQATVAAEHDRKMVAAAAFIVKAHAPRNATRARKASVREQRRSASCSTRSKRAARARASRASCRTRAPDGRDCRVPRRRSRTAAAHGVTQGCPAQS
jgi:hypothetical protein